MTIGRGSLLRFLLANVLALVVTLVIGYHAGFPVNAERTIERLDEYERELGPHGTVMRDSERKRRTQEVGLNSPPAAGFRPTIVTDIRSILQWYNVVFALAFAGCLVLFRPGPTAFYLAAIGSLALWTFAGYRIGIPYLVVYGVYALISFSLARFRPQAPRI